MSDTLAMISRLEDDAKNAAKRLKGHEGRYFVDLYYSLQEHRKAVDNQVRSLKNSEQAEPSLLLEHFAQQIGLMERQVIPILDEWTDQSGIGRWCKSQMGIGPTITAGFMAQIDITRAPTAGAIWRFAGLDSTMVWISNAKASKLYEEYEGDPLARLRAISENEGVGMKLETLLRFATQDKEGNEVTPTKRSVVNALCRRPYNARLKVLCWKTADSFVKTSNKPESFYGQLYRQRKAYEEERDANGENAEKAAKALEERNFTDKKTIKIYKSGHYPQGRLDNQARRYAVKMFLSHYHEVAYFYHYDKLPPAPYILTQENHTHYIPPPNAPEGLLRLHKDAHPLDVADTIEVHRVNSPKRAKTANEGRMI